MGFLGQKHCVMVRRKATIAILSILPVLAAGCIPLSVSDDWKEQRRDVIDRQMAEASSPISLNYFAFLKENNPGLEEDIVCNCLSTTTLPFLLTGQLDMPCMLVPTFSLEYGTMFCNGEKVVSGESEIYCSFNQDALIRIEGTAGKNEYHFLSFVPYSGLPVIEIVYGRNNADGPLKDWTDAVMSVHGMGSCPDVRDSIRIDNLQFMESSPKRSFRMETRDEMPLLGMDRSSSWCFLANYGDRTQLRNSVAFEIGRLAGGLEWTPSSEYANVVVNGQYQGVYQIAEQISVGDRRLDIAGGYILKLDSRYDEVWRFHPRMTRWNVNIVSPTGDDCSYEKLLYVKSYWEDMESCLANADYESLCSVMDMESFIDYGLVQSLTASENLSKQKSVFCYKKRDGRLYAGPLWDFEQPSFSNDSFQLFTGFLWYGYMSADAGFQADVKRRWNILKPAVEAGIYGYIDSLACIISSAVTNGDRIWNTDEDMEFDASVSHLKAFIKRRIEWMDNEIKALTPGTAL